MKNDKKKSHVLSLQLEVNVDSKLFCIFLIAFVSIFANQVLHCSWWHPVSLCHTENKRRFDMPREQKPLHKSVLIKNWPSIHNGVAACFTHIHTHRGYICLQKNSAYKTESGKWFIWNRMTVATYITKKRVMDSWMSARPTDWPG